MSIPLAVCVALGRLDWAPYAVFGAINSAYGKQLDYGPRLRAQAGMGLALTAAVLAGTGVGISGAGSFLTVAAMAAFSAIGSVLARTRGWLPVPSLFLVFAVGTLSSFPHAVGDLVLALLLPAGAATFALGLGQVGRWLPTSRRPRQPAPARVSLRAHLSQLTGRFDLLTHALGPLLAGSVALVAGLGHPYWAAVTATVPLAGSTLAARASRATLRVGGTLVGVLLAYALLAGDPSPWFLVGAVAVLQVLTELFVARHYGIAVIAITPMALILTRLGGGTASVDRLVSDRVVETVLGAAVALAVLVAVRPLELAALRRGAAGPPPGSTRPAARADRTGSSAPDGPRL
ncbi:FUSC family protein [Cellulomonas denverensis]|uniref:FUSC family protein n=1 Tax=Cellulomonas denverensis TaxID=264297 RepID=A0A7X6KYQ7_9CELL|nr:FUSC family protein [Cellulomonas denverensis]NKY24454.1 FUSC family protein [Cellulomonas denverensis]